MVHITPNDHSVSYDNLYTDRERTCRFMFIAIFADDERNVFLKLAWEDKFYFYVQCMVMYLMTLIFGLILALDHGSGSITVTTKAFNALQMINIILRFIMTYGLIAQEEDRRKLYFHSVLMLVFFVLTAIAYS